MKSKLYKILLSLTLILTMVHLTGYSQGDGDKAKRLEAQKAAYITSELDLSPEEAQVFWPVYNKYQDELKELRRDLRDQLRGRDVKDLSEAESKAILQSLTETEESEVALKKKYNSELLNIITANKLVQLHVLEREFKNKVVNRIKDRMKRRARKEK